MAVTLSPRRSRIVAGGMLREGTPVEDRRRWWGLLVKREDLACPPPGPPFSKARGVYARIASRPEKVIGVLDTYHSQAGHAVARACQVLGKKCINYYPEYKNEPGWREAQERARELGAELVGLPAGRSCILYHAASRLTEEIGGYVMPNALKLEESVTETARECPKTHDFRTVIIPTSSGTIAAGVVKGMGRGVRYVIHLGYSRPRGAVEKYVREASGVPDAVLEIVDEGYSYKDVARPGPTPEWPCNAYYDLKAFRWWEKEGRKTYKEALLWNIG